MTSGRYLLLASAILCILIVSACKKDTSKISCEGTLFGIPYPNTGCDSIQCRPVCECKDFTSKDFTSAELDALRSWTLTTPFDELRSNPYDEPAPTSDPAVCAMIVEDLAARLYRLETFPNEEAARAANAILTHHDACGVCSTLPDFSVYAKDRDIGTAVRTCIFANFTEPIDSLVVCLEGLGFTKPCAQIWAYNSKNTQALCFQPCFSSNLYHNPDGTLGECLDCDEQNSGPVFKAIAGRTRRNTGLASSICRPCEEVKPVEHDYPF